MPEPHMLRPTLVVKSYISLSSNPVLITKSIAMPPKRKSSASTTSSSKKPKAPPIVTLGKAAFARFSNGETLDEDQITDLVNYIQDLESQVEYNQKAATSLNRKGGKELSESEIEAEADRLRRIVERGILKLMKWKPSCKTGSATFSFEGMCSTPAVMASFLSLNKPEDVTKFKAKRYTHEEFEEKVMQGDIRGSARYSSLYLTGNVNLHWNSETEEYKFTGRYGQYGTGNSAKVDA